MHSYTIDNLVINTNFYDTSFTPSFIILTSSGVRCTNVEEFPPKHQEFFFKSTTLALSVSINAIMHMLYYFFFSLESHRWHYKLNVLVHKIFNANSFQKNFFY